MLQSMMTKRKEEKESSSSSSSDMASSMKTLHKYHHHCCPNYQYRQYHPHHQIWRLHQSSLGVHGHLGSVTGVHISKLAKIVKYAYLHFPKLLPIFVFSLNLHVHGHLGSVTGVHISELARVANMHACIFQSCAKI